VNLEAHTLAWTWKETVNRLDSYARDVREAKNVMEASNFARWLLFSGLIGIFEMNPSSTPHLIVDADAVTKKVKDLLYECGELFRGGKADPKYAASDIAEINRKLDTLLERQTAEAVTHYDTRNAFFLEPCWTLDRNPVTARNSTNG
jgi:hypothetical protein